MQSYAMMDLRQRYQRELRPGEKVLWEGAAHGSSAVSGVWFPGFAYLRSLRCAPRL